MIIDNLNALEEMGEDEGEENELFLYQDKDGVHADAARQLIAIARENLQLVQGASSTLNAALNPAFALPAAYETARKICEANQKPLSRSKEIVPLSAKDIQAAERQLTQLLNSFSIRDGGATNLLDAFDQEGEETLGHAFQTRAEALVKNIEEKHSFQYLSSDDPVIVCEALGQLCVEELARIKQTKALTQGKPTAQTEGRLLLEHDSRVAEQPPTGRRGRGGSNTVKKPDSD